MVWYVSIKFAGLGHGGSNPPTRTISGPVSINGRYDGVTPSPLCRFESDLAPPFQDVSSVGRAVDF